MKQAKFKVYRDKAHGWRWTLLGANGKVIADSGEAYTRKYDCQRAVGRVIHAVLFAGAID